MRLFTVKNDNGEYAHIDMDELTWETGFATLWFGVNKPYAKRTASDYGGHVVELVEKTAKIVVSEEEDKVLKKAKNTTVWRPASVIAGYAYEHEQQGDDEVLLEDRLMRAYVIGWTVEKPKLWNVKVKYAQDSYYYKTHVLGKPIVRAFQIAGGNKLDDRAAFTLAEIERYGLQDCEKVEVTDDEQ